MGEAISAPIPAESASQHQRHNVWCSCPRPKAMWSRMRWLPRRSTTSVDLRPDSSGTWWSSNPVVSGVVPEVLGLTG